MARAKVIHMGDACKILVEGDPKKRPEPSENIIEFPGGGIAVIRTSDNTYWAHIVINNGDVNDDMHMESKNGEIFDTRIEFKYEDGQNEIVPIVDPNNEKYIRHIAVRVRVK